MESDARLDQGDQTETTDHPPQGRFKDDLLEEEPKRQMIGLLSVAKEEGSRGSLRNTFYTAILEPYSTLIEGLSVLIAECLTKSRKYPTKLLSESLVAS